MAVYRLGETLPSIDSTAWVADSAQVIGDVHLGDHASVWFVAVLRGDNTRLHIGCRSNIQDGAIVHSDVGSPVHLGDDVTVGHQAMLHGCTVGDGSLIGIQAVVLNGARIGKGCLVAAGAVVTEGKEFPDGSLIMGAPAKVARELTPEQLAGLLRSAASYVAKAQQFKSSLVRID
ncbi:MAG: gamma carbonic anhydrase family protein [Burkholderiales bacterium 28-67-8]|nr:MAG: gamma carbonic anhydrase family protein [Burkholderiales bacterium 28-67-8]